MALSIAKGFAFVSNKEDELMKQHERSHSRTRSVCSQTAGQPNVWLPFPGLEEVNELSEVAPRMRSVMKLYRHCRCLHLAKLNGLSMRTHVLTACSLHLKVPGSKISDRRPTILTVVLRGFS
jgi:hypothetical protein